jgi:hypothetical protein
MRLTIGVLAGLQSSHGECHPASASIRCRLTGRRQDVRGAGITGRTGLRLFHNHISIELALPHFDYGTPAFRRIDGEIRRRVIAEVADSDLRGLVFTYFWAFDLPEDQAFVDQCAMPFRERGGRVLFLELEAAQAERLKRNECLSRLAEKPSMRDLEASRRRLLELDAGYQLNSGGKFDERSDYLRIDNTLLMPAEVAERVIEHFDLPRLTSAALDTVSPAESVRYPAGRAGC